MLTKNGLSVMSLVDRYLGLVEGRLAVHSRIILPDGGAMGSLASKELKKVFAASGKSGLVGLDPICSF